MQRSLGELDLFGELLLPLAVALAGAGLVWLVLTLLRRPLALASKRYESLVARATPLLLGLLVAGYVVALGSLSLTRHHALKSHAYDLGIFTQVLWNTSQGRWFENTVMIEYSANLLGQHFAPVFLLLVPLYWVWPDPRALLLLQTVALGLGALPVYALAKRRLASAGVALLLAAAYLLLPALHYLNLFDFHEIALTTPLLLGAVYWFDRRQPLPLAACLGLALLCREEIAITVMAFGVALLVVRRWRWGLALLIVGASWLLVTVGWAVPHFQNAPVYYFVVRYGWLGDSIPEILLTVLTRPLWVLSQLATAPRLEYLVRLLGPLGLLPPLGLPIFALSLPTFGYLLLSNYKEQYDIVNQYSAPLLPFLMAGTILACSWLARWRPFRSVAGRYALASYVLVAAVATTIAFGPTPLGRRHDPEQFMIDNHTRFAQEAFRRIPPDASLSVQSDLLPHLAHRREVYLYPNIHDAQYVLLDNWSDYWPLTPEQFGRALDELWNNPLYRLLWQEDGYGIFQRVDPLPIQHPLRIPFAAGGRPQLELVGYDLPPQPLPAGEPATIGLYWRPVTPIEVRRVRFRAVSSLQLLGPEGRAIAQVDKEPWDGLLTTDRIKQGAVYYDRYRLLIPPDAPAGSYQLRVVVYSYYSKRPWTVFDLSGQSTGQFSAPFATVEVAGR
ncbi:MAG: hypothetical protein KatS3mg061_0307 [Dehalococcoidia bacterium]|nr:MAG: hypothetical protein KatS3mg061_0307 [Dehalococcoidia bacterium]